MPIDARLYFPAHLDLHHASKILTGISALSRRRVLNTSVSTENPWDLDDLTLGMELTQEGHVCRVAFDMRDRSDSFCRGALAACDTYWKRGYVRRDLLGLPPDWRAKIRAFGLNVACRGEGSTTLVLRRWLRGLLPLGAEFRQQARRMRKYLGALPARKLCQRPDADVQPVVLFQTRVWQPEEIRPDDPDEVNETRVQLVRVLRRRLGHSFWGGLVPTAYARQHYPDALTDLPTHRRDYMELCQRALVCVNSRGLHHSNAFKLAEYLAASKAIVSDALTQELPRPLLPGTHLLQYQDAEECAYRCAQLLADPELVHEMRHANHRYYQSEVEPAAHVFNCVRRSLAVPVEGLPLAA
jgi:hypothetical protein